MEEHRTPPEALIRTRVEKLVQMRALGKDPFAIERYERWAAIKDPGGDKAVEPFSTAAIAAFEENEPKEEGAEGPRVEASLAGRIVSMRVMGKASFAHIEDREGRIQVYFKADELGGDYELVKLLDLGDFIGVKGSIFRTRTGEVSIHAEAVTVLTKSIRPIPFGKEKGEQHWYGLQDVEQRYRLRHVDLITNHESRGTFVNRSRIIRAIREFYDNRVFWLATVTVEQAAAMLIAELKEGLDLHSYNGPVVERVTAKAGVIKVGSGYGTITPFERKAFQAAVIAQQETGAPIVTHTQGGTMALEQIELFRQMGADLQRVALSHTQRNPDPWYHKQLLDAGVSLCYDGPARTKYFSDNVIAGLIHEMVKAGYQKQIMLSMDAGRASYQKPYGGIGMDYLLTTFVPRLRSEGLSQAAIDDILIHNPARFFAMGK